MIKNKKPNITQIIDELKMLQKSSDTEMAHSDADGLLCDLLCDLGYEKVVKEYIKIDKWYA